MEKVSHAEKVRHDDGKPTANLIENIIRDG